MAVPPKKPQTNAALVTDQLPEPNTFVELELLVNGLTKVTVRVTNEDIEQAKHKALVAYIDTLSQLRKAGCVVDGPVPKAPRTTGKEQGRANNDE